MDDIDELTDPDEVPPLLPPEQMPPVTTQARLHHTWRALMGRLGFGRPQVWVLYLHDDGRVAHLAHFEDPPGQAPLHEVCHAASLFAAGRGPGMTCAFLYCRPGRSRRTQDDLVWLMGLASTPGDWPVHMATDESITVFAPDDEVAVA